MTGNTPTTLNNLSPELLSEIFWHSVYDDPYGAYVPRAAPLLLGRVCSRWRTISISTPELWSTIVIGGHTSNITDKYRSDMVCAAVWIKRSGTRPLTFYVNDYGHPPEDNGAALRQVLDSVVSHCRRWRTLRASLPFEFMKILLAPLMEGNTPKLENFQSYSTSPPGITLVLDRPPFVLSSAPRLKRLELIGAPIHIDFGDEIHHVRFISVGPRERAKLSLGDLLRCVTRCQSVTILLLSIRESSITATLQRSLPTVIVLANLRTLTLNLSAGVDTYLVFDRLFLPSIEYLRLAMNQCAQTDWSYLGSMLERSRPPLACLYLHGVPMTDKTLIECLSFTPKLIEAFLCGISCSDVTLASLTIDEKEGSNSAMLCPYLSNIGFGSPSLFSPNALKSMILSRWLASDQVSDIIPGKALHEVRCSPELVDNLFLDPDILHCARGGLTLAEWYDLEDE
ncbi:hypothetical protein BD410DRAFT_788684 [Rickenella mellea]|uniref:Uncharacterized protein n=1 Tax=Rickenella mellea TaxID=50990 RepID=A0A4Y7Q519_9AGAM|nr:hypothetical protein BD410DRAFT_788684 [Rickenella mellea]